MTRSTLDSDGAMPASLSHVVPLAQSTVRPPIRHGPLVYPRTYLLSKASTPSFEGSPIARSAACTAIIFSFLSRCCSPIEFNSLFNCRCDITLCCISLINPGSRTTLNQQQTSNLPCNRESLSTDFSCTCVLNGKFCSDFSCSPKTENSLYLSHLQKYVSHILHIQLARW